MHFMTAEEAQKLTEAVNRACDEGVYSNLTDALEKIEKTALLGKSSTHFEGYGVAVKLPELISALEGLGYKVQDVSNMEAPNTSCRYLERSITVSW